MIGQGDGVEIVHAVSFLHNDRKVPVDIPSASIGSAYSVLHTADCWGSQAGRFQYIMEMSLLRYLHWTSKRVPYVSHGVIPLVRK